jgi:uncharacterized LabA/DUF88 family protein
VEGFCLVTSDSDFTRLATRLREAGMQVIGMGQKKTPSPFISACDKFIYIEILAKPAIEEPAKENRKDVEATVTESIKKVDRSLIQIIASTITDLADESGWAFLGEVGNLIPKKQPDFDPRNYGFKKLLPLIKSIGKFEVDQRQTEKENIKLVYVRVK